MRVSATPASLRRLHARRAESMDWTPGLLDRLERLHLQDPKLWWHVEVVVPEQVSLVETAVRLGQRARLSAPLLDALARARSRREVARALCTVLRVVSIRPPDATWTSLEAVACTLLHVEEGRFDPPGPVVPVLELAPWARPLCTPADLAEHGRLLDTCLGQRTWWRSTARQQGLAFAIEWDREAATAWLVPDDENGAVIEMLTGPGNDRVSESLSAAVQSALRAALAECPDPFRRCEPTVVGGWGGVQALDVCNAREAVLEALGPGSARVTAVPFAPIPAAAPPGQPPARWTRYHDAFARSERFGPRGQRGGRDTDADPPSGVAGWAVRSGGLELRTAHGRVTVFPTVPPTVRFDAVPAQAPVLWFSTLPSDHHDPEIPEDARHAMALFTSFLPLRVVDAHRIDPRLGGFLGVWATCSAPSLLDLFESWPVLVGPVLDRLHAAPGTLRSLQEALEGARGTASAERALGWLGCTRPHALVSWLPRLSAPATWGLDAMQRLDRLLGVSEAVRHLRRLHAPGTAQLALLHAAWASGLLDRVRVSLLHAIGAFHAGEWTASRLQVALEILAGARAEGANIPAIRSLPQLARLLIEHRVPPPLALPPCALPGPWGTPLPDLAAVGRVAAELGHDPVRWQSAVWSGQLCCVGRPGGVPAVTWLAPAGRRGAVELVDVLGWDGGPAPEPVRAVVRAGLRAHADRLDTLEPGWTAEDARAAGLPLGLGSITLAGHLPLGQLVDVVLMLDED